MRINDPLASFARFEREKNRVNLVCPANLKTAANLCGQYCDTFLEMEFRINSYEQRQGLQICVVIQYLALPCSMIVAIEQISFIGWSSCIPRTFFF